jgi:tRNA pseudouridine55 synthase
MSRTGFLVVDKPPGPTSHDIVAQARRATGITKIGHAGTLDPPATGALVLALGRATRLIRYVQDFDKEYHATVSFGIATTTGDATGEEVERRPMPISAGEVEGVLAGFRGKIEQVPPMVSALKIGGKRLYEIARKGEEVERLPRPVHVYELELKSFEPGEHPQAELRVVCSKGTYIRTLADDIAVALGGRAHLNALRRTRVGEFSVARSPSPLSWEGWEKALLPLEAAAAGMEQVILDEAESQAVSHGRPVASSGPEGPLAMVDDGGRLMAVYRRSGEEARAEVVLA